MRKAITCWIISNSPGELSNWVAPICRELSKLTHSVQSTLFLTPCPYASGQEREYALELPTIERVITAKDTVRIVLKGKRLETPESGVILFLGGDPMYAKRLKKLYPQMQLLGYSELGFNDSSFDREFCRKDGDLMASRVSQYQKLGKEAIANRLNLDPNQKHCVLFTGSRPRFFKAQYPFMIEIANSLKTLKPVLVISPFISDELLAELQAKHPCSYPIRRSNESLAFFELADFFVTIPGSSTAEAMYMNTPMMMILPLNQPETLIFDGLLGLLAYVPGLSFLIRKLLIWITRKQKRFFSLPNIIANRPVIPEKVGILDPIQLASEIETYHQEADQMRDALSKIPKRSDMAQKIANEVQRLYTDSK